MRELDDIVELVNEKIEDMSCRETLMNKIYLRNDDSSKLSKYILWLDAEISVYKNILFSTFSCNDMIPFIENQLVSIISIGVYCLEEFADVFEGSCPWEYDFDLEPRYSYFDVGIIMEYFINISKMNKAEMILYNKNNMKSLYNIKRLVIIGISSFLQH